MKTRVKIEYSKQSKGNYGYATTEHAASSYGRPVITIGNEVFGVSDLVTRSGTVVTADKALAEDLSRIGYPVRLSNPQATYRGNNPDTHRTISARVTHEEYSAFADYCQSIGKTPNSIIREWIVEAIE